MKIFESLHAAKIMPIKIPSKRDEALTKTVINAPLSITSPHPFEPNENNSVIGCKKKRPLKKTGRFF